MFIEQLRSERQAFAAERRNYIERLMYLNCKKDELETARQQGKLGQTSGTFVLLICLWFPVSRVLWFLFGRLLLTGWVVVRAF